MQRSEAERLLAIYQRAARVLGEADPILRALAEPERGQHLRALAGMHGEFWEKLQRPVVRAFPGLDPDIEIAVAAPGELAGVASLYAAAGYGAPVGAADTVIVARLIGRVVGAVRLCPEDGVTVLRGMQVERAFQRQGLGARLLAACLPHLAGREAFCLPYAHLARFYAAAGFETVDAPALPAFLASRLAGYRAGGQDVIAMRRTPGPSILSTTGKS